MRQQKPKLKTALAKRLAFLFAAALFAAPLHPACASAPVSTNDPLAGKQGYLDSVHAREAWSYVSVGKPVTIAVIDTGVDASHPDLSGVVRGGYDAANPTSGGLSRAQTDQNGHGTHAAGIAAATCANGIGIAGVSFGAQILPINIDKRDGTDTAITSAAIQRAYEYLLSTSKIDVNSDGELQSIAKEYNVRVANLSIGSEWVDDTDSADCLQDAACLAAIKKADEAGILTVCSAGNVLPGVPLPYRAWPADSDICLGVGAIDGMNRLSSSTNYGANFIYAPGVDNLTTIARGGYKRISGSSGAAAIASGIAAMVFQASPSLTATKVRAILYKTATDLGAVGQDECFGYGKINALAAMEQVAGNVKKGRAVKRDGIVYKVTAAKQRKHTVCAYAVSDRDASKLVIPATVTVCGKAYKVTSVRKKSFKGCKKLKSVVVGKNVKTIGARAFVSCPKLKTLTVKTKRLRKKTVKNALKGSSIQTIKAPRGKKAIYQKLFVKRYAGRTANVR